MAGTLAIQSFTHAPREQVVRQDEAQIDEETDKDEAQFDEEAEKDVQYGYRMAIQDEFSGEDVEKAKEGEQDKVEDAEPDEDANLDSDVDDCILMSGLQEALATKAEQAVKVEEKDEQADPNEAEEAGKVGEPEESDEPVPEEIEQAEEGTGAASSNAKPKRKDVRTGRKRRELNV